MSDNPGTPAAGPVAGASVPTPDVALKRAAKAAESEGNPALRMMGLPRLRIPSRNWLIFLSITGSFTGAVLYDRYQKKRIIRKWCDLVAPIAEEHLPADTMPRRVTIYLSAPPADGLRSAREHFHEYVKPVLVAAALDWDVVEGRREGDVRWGTADKVRKLRRRREGLPPEEDDVKSAVQDQRERVGTKEWEGVGGDVVIGRNTWKEYVRGIHEGWLGPLDKPVEVTPVEAGSLSEAGEARDTSGGVSSLGDAAVTAAANLATNGQTSSDNSEFVKDDMSPQATEIEQPKPAEEKKAEEKPKPKNLKPDPFIPTTSYAGASLPRSFPDALGPTTIIPFPHILGFFNTPIRTYRFLTQRRLADDVGRKVAAMVLASYRPFDSPAGDVDEGWEQQGLLTKEEPEWHKSVRNKEREEGVESVWLDSVVMDQRIAERMRRFEILKEDEDRADALYKQPRKEEKEE